MKQKIRATEAAPIQDLTGAKVRQEKDIEKVLDFFRYKVGTTLDCITWYVKDLEQMGLLQAIYKARDKRTHFMAKHYSADPSKWVNKPDTKLSLFGEG